LYFWTKEANESNSEKIIGIGTENKDYNTFVSLDILENLMYLNVKYINFYY